MKIYGGSFGAGCRAGLLRMAVTATLAVAAPTLAAQAEEVKIGGSFGLTGGLAPYAPSLVDAARLAVQQVNDGGGILGGKQLQLAAEPVDQCLVRRGLQVADRVRIPIRQLMRRRPGA